MNAQNLPPLVARTARIEGINPWNIFFFWGDYNVIITVRPEQMEAFIRVAKMSYLLYGVLGRISDGPPGLFGVVGDERRPLRVVRNENFVRLGFSGNVGDHVNYMLHEEL